MDLKQHKIVIMGKGMIGMGFAALLTGNGIPVTVFAKGPEIALARYDEIFSYLEENQLVTSSQTAKCRSLLHFTNSYEDIADTTIILECIAEKLDIKQDVYAKLEVSCPQLAVIASASSAISPDDLCAKMNRKDILLVAHPYNPAYLVPCVEVVPSGYTSTNALDITCHLLEYLSREVIVMKKAAPGFIANRLQHALIREALHMVEAGIADPADIDRALMTSFMPRYTSIGLLENIDNAGLDLEVNVEDYLFRELGNEDSAPAYLKERVARGEVGAKAGKGIFDNWTPEKIQDLHRRAAQPYLSFFNWKLP